jgi:hypothetical protein
MAFQECVKTHTDYVDLSMLGKGVWDHQLGNKECITCIIQRCPSTPLFAKYALLVADFISSISVSPYVNIL